MRVEALVGGQLAEHQRDDLEFGVGLAGAFRPAFRIVDMLAIQLGVGVQLFPSDRGTGQLLNLGLGVRFEPRIGELGRIFVDANANWGRTDDRSRFSMDFGVGLELRAHDLFSIGPMLRYSHLFAGDNDFPQDAITLWGGVSAVVRMGREEEIEVDDTDTDADGILDVDDLCPQIPAGERPDPARRGCPMDDRDADGIADRVDVCPDEPAGEHPDPERHGCPEADSDEDGVLDSDDACPATPAGEVPDPERPGCPDSDFDSDGVTDSRDQCPEAHMGVHPDPERRGCPLPDRDNDMVPDVNDACPDEPGAPHEDPEKNGCPTLVYVQNNQIHINRPVFFATASDRILPRSMPVMNALRDAMRASPFIRRISIDGHTDDRGDDDYNMELSMRRANSVMAWLVEHGVEPDRLEAHGFGETRPLIDDTNRRARRINRRVEFKILDPAPSEPQTAQVEETEGGAQ